MNPRFDPKKSECTTRYRAVQFRQDCVARCYSQQEQSRQNVRNHLRREDNLTYAGERDELMDILEEAGATMRWPDEKIMTRLSEWLSTALRHKPFFNGGLSQRFRNAVWSFDEYDGWVHIPNLLKSWPPQGPQGLPGQVPRRRRHLAPRAALCISGVAYLNDS